MTQNRFTVTQPVMLGIYRAVVPPDPISNSEVKRSIADDSVGFPHVKVGQCQALILKASSLDEAFFMAAFSSIRQFILTPYHF